MSRPRATGPTQATIARATGVSVPTVSKALRADPSISARTRDLVLASAHELGYPVPGAPTAQAASAAAPTPPGRTRRRISVLFDMVDNAYAAELLEGLLSAARTLEFALQIDHVGVSADRLGPEAEGTTLLLGEQALEGADGLVLVTTPVPPALLQRCHELGAPLLAIDPATQPPTGVVSLSATNWRGGRQATDHLIGLGHRRIGVICGQRSSVPAVERLAGYHSALAQAGISPEADLIRPGRFGFDAGLTEGTADDSVLLGHVPPSVVVGSRSRRRRRRAGARPGTRAALEPTSVTRTSYVGARAHGTVGRASDAPLYGRASPGDHPGRGPGPVVPDTPDRVPPVGEVRRGASQTSGCGSMS